MKLKYYVFANFGQGWRLELETENLEEAIKKYKECDYWKNQGIKILVDAETNGLYLK